MKGIFVAYDQAYNMEVADALEKLGCRGFTMWQDIANSQLCSLGHFQQSNL